MKKLYSILTTALFCMLFWIIFVLQDINILKLDSQEVITGIIVSLIVAYFTHKFFIKENPFWLLNFKRLGSLIAFIPIYAWELYKANWDVAKRALSPKLNINPGIVKIETEIESEYGLAMLANCITLTPGTITMDIVEEDGKNYMYIHWIDVAATEIKEASNTIKGAFEPWVRRIFK